MVADDFNPKGQMQEDLYELEASLIYTGSSRPTRACLNNNNNYYYYHYDHITDPTGVSYQQGV